MCTYISQLLFIYLTPQDLHNILLVRYLCIITRSVRKLNVYLIQSLKNCKWLKFVSIIKPRLLLLFRIRYI